MHGEAVRHGVVLRGSTERKSLAHHTHTDRAFCSFGEGNFVSLRWPTYHFEAFLHDAGLHRRPHSDLLPVVSFHQVRHLHKRREEI